jgi:hypothetical protein
MRAIGRAGRPRSRAADQEARGLGQRLRWVADRPMRVNRRPHKASSRSSVSARCAPRLLPASAWISSTITLRTPASIARPDSEPSRMYSDSGVVTMMCGGRLRHFARSACGVSPVRTALRISTVGRPSAPVPRGCPAAGAPGSGACRSTAPSAARRTPPAWRCRQRAASASRTSASSACRKAVSVLPEPVGAATSVSRPDAIAGQAAAVGRRWARGSGARTSRRRPDGRRRAPRLGGGARACQDYPPHRHGRHARCGPSG